MRPKERGPGKQIGTKALAPAPCAPGVAFTEPLLCIRLRDNGGPGLRCRRHHHESTTHVSAQGPQELIRGPAWLVLAPPEPGSPPPPPQGWASDSQLPLISTGPSASQPHRHLLVSNNFFFLPLLGLHPRHREVPRLGVHLGLWPPAYTTVTATWDPSSICDLHHSSRQHQILNPLSKARDRT